MPQCRCMSRSRAWRLRSSAGSDVEGGHLAQIPDEQAAIGDDWVVPGLAVYCGEARQLLVPLGAGLDDGDVSLLGQHDELFADQDRLAISVTAALPFLLTGRGVDAGQNRLVESVEVALVQQRARELVLHPGVLPDGPGREPIAR